ncbi:MAG TPA: NAD(P)H-binding protein, partial [Rubrobacteraceae bacterium]|nr:NAD(P)H-binding protein [Rubrobacteraceae bacterium]
VGGTDVVVHCASSPRKTRQMDVEGTKRLLRAAGRAGVSHVVFISIVGVDRNPYFPYYRLKLEVERIVERSPVPWTILRATQFHEFVLGLIRFLDRIPVMMIPKGFLLQPIETGEVADRLVELALLAPTGRAPDVGGPEVRTAVELARAYFEAVGRRCRVVEVPLPSKTARAFREGAQLCPDQRYGKIWWEEFL